MCQNTQPESFCLNSLGAKEDSYENSNISLALPATLSQIRFTSINIKCLASVFDTQEIRMGIIHKASS